MLSSDPKPCPHSTHTQPEPKGGSRSTASFSHLMTNPAQMAGHDTNKAIHNCLWLITEDSWVFFACFLFFLRTLHCEELQSESLHSTCGCSGLDAEKNCSLAARDLAGPDDHSLHPTLEQPLCCSALFPLFSHSQTVPESVLARDAFY